MLSTKHDASGGRAAQYETKYSKVFYLPQKCAAKKINAVAAGKEASAAATTMHMQSVIHNMKLNMNVMCAGVGCAVDRK